MRTAPRIQSTLVSSFKPDCLAQLCNCDKSIDIPETAPSHTASRAPQTSLRSQQHTQRASPHQAPCAYSTTKLQPYNLSRTSTLEHWHQANSAKFVQTPSGGCHSTHRRLWLVSTADEHPTGQRVTGGTHAHGTHGPCLQEASKQTRHLLLSPRQNYHANKRRQGDTR
jgi:hypothetical protein